MEPNKVRCSRCGKRNPVPAAVGGRPRCAECHQWLPWIVSTGDQDFPQVFETLSVPVLVDLRASWCGLCQMVSPALERLAAERAGQLKLVKVDVDKAPLISQRFTVRTVPTMLLINHGQVLARQLVATSVAALRHWLETSLAEHHLKETRL
jgi:thioredoxin 2